MRVALILSSISAVTTIAASQAIPTAASEMASEIVERAPELPSPAIDPIPAAELPATEEASEEAPEIAPIVPEIASPAIDPIIPEAPAVEEAPDMASPAIDTIPVPDVPVSEEAPEIAPIVPEMASPAIDPIIPKAPATEEESENGPEIASPITEPVPIPDLPTTEKASPAIDQIPIPELPLTGEAPEIAPQIASPDIDQIPIPEVPATDKATEIAPEIAPEVASPPADPVSVPKSPVRTSSGVIPEDILDAMQGIQILASNLILQAYDIRGDGVKPQIIGNTYLRCRDLTDGIEKVSGGISRPPTMLFSWEDQMAICSNFDVFGINQSRVITALVMELESIF
ncbi:uncharacterized protein FIESC28_04547 [Fusarium coffeatum]|uniref:Uncharacterized protein n=1 Tax=Fusarium coffeatum TaxID=231269 RepID=A0A366RZ51_9HYPO|nr:uncharacterized protein FIESC28_04547 [Fusarium coffeatum]RBR22353.1 hypothetical protein FIESC28_04547 [Fusarium coffeatum]